MTETAYNPEDEHGIYDVIIVGGGPCGLAVAARLREETPSAMFTDEEQQRYHWIRRHEGKMSIKNRKTKVTMRGRSQQPTRQGYSMTVIDNSGSSWMSKWDRLFKTFEITHLRSPMFFHVDPRNRDGMLGYAYEHGRASELLRIDGCVGVERSKHQRKKDRGHAGKWRETAVDERDRSDYFTPSTPLFHDHCREVIDKYDLKHLIAGGENLMDIDYSYVESVSEVDRIFTVSTNKTRRFARTVVLAVGAGNVPCIPGMPGTKQTNGACHAMHIQQFPDEHVKQKIDKSVSTQVVIVGGGLTGAHLAVNAIEKGVTKVYMLVRGHLKVKPFDIDLSWMGKFRNVQQAAFWSADTDEERWEQIQVARGGGSITPRIQKVLKRYCECGRLVIHTGSTIKHQVFDDASRQWSLQMEPEMSLPPIDYIYYATGIPSDYSKLPYLQTLLQKYPIDGIGGLPRLNDDMAWCDDVPLFMTGKLASLRIGPGAPNLAGARIGAERIAWCIQERLNDVGAKEAASDKYNLGIGNRFDSLLTGSETDGAEETDGSQSGDSQ